MLAQEEVARTTNELNEARAEIETLKGALQEAGVYVWIHVYICVGLCSHALALSGSSCVCIYMDICIYLCRFMFSCARTLKGALQGACVCVCVCVCVLV